MTIPVQTIYNAYTANGVTTVFAYGFKILASADLRVTVNEVVVTTGFAISGVGVDGGGSVTFTTAPTSTHKVLIELHPVFERTTDYPQYGDLLATVLNNDLDRPWLALQKINNDISRSIKLPVDTATDQVLAATAAQRANKSIKFNASGNLILTDADPDANAASAAAVLGDIAPAIHIATNKTTPVGADELGIWDSVSGLLNRLSFANLVTYLSGLCSAGWNAATATNATKSGIPQNSQSAAYTMVLADANTHILHPTADNNARTFTIPSNASVAYDIGTTITFVNQINTVTIAITTDTMTLAGVGTTGSRTLAANGMATALKVSATGWVISGSGLT